MSGPRKYGSRGGGPLSAQFLDIKPDMNAATELFPKIVVPIQGAPSESEQHVVSQFLNIRSDVRDGPFYTGKSYGSGSGSKSSKGKPSVEFEKTVEDGIKRYTDRYIKKRKIGRSVDEHPYVVEFFPQELHSIMGIKKSKAGVRRRLDVSKFLNAEVGVSPNNDPKEQKLGLLEQLALQHIEQEKGEEEEEVDEGEENEEEEEDVYDDEDEDDDYNAEKYFDDGGDDGDNDDDDGEAAY